MDLRGADLKEGTFSKGFAWRSSTRCGARLYSGIAMLTAIVGLNVLLANKTQAQAPVVQETSTQKGPLLAITWDDLPAHNVLPPGETRLDVAKKVLSAMQAEHLPPVYGFINGLATVNEPRSEAVLEEWTKAGNLLGNHGWSHMNLNEHTAAQFEEDVDKNEALLGRWMGDKDWHWLRYPYLAEGKTPEQKLEVRAYLAKKNYKVAAVTMAFPDYDWAGPYARCVAKNDSAGIAELEKAYLQAARDSAAYSRAMSSALYGKDIPYVLLVHIGALDARMLPRLLALYRELGFNFTTLAQAESDPFYAADTDPASHAEPAQLEARMYMRKLPFPKPPIYPKFESLCR